MSIPYRLFRAIARLISKLPFTSLYALSDFLAWCLIHLIRYRKSVILLNLRNSFPGKSEAEIRRIMHGYYSNLADVFLETVKVEGMTIEQLTSRVKISNMEIIEDLRLQGKSIIVVTAHMGNWEWFGPAVVGSMGNFDYALVVVKPLSDKDFQKHMSMLRSHFFADRELPFKSTYRTLASRKDKLNFTLILADQTPHKDEITFQTRFLNQTTPVFLGPEKIARSLDHAVVYMHSHRSSRGHYDLSFELISKDPKTTKELEITYKHLELLEKDIQAYPECWLWSHKRWKYAQNENPVS